MGLMKKKKTLIRPPLSLPLHSPAGATRGAIVVDNDEGVGARPLQHFGQVFLGFNLAHTPDRARAIPPDGAPSVSSGLVRCACGGRGGGHALFAAVGVEDAARLDAGAGRMDARPPPRVDGGRRGALVQGGRAVHPVEPLKRCKQRRIVRQKQRTHRPTRSHGAAPPASLRPQRAPCGPSPCPRSHRLPWPPHAGRPRARPRRGPARRRRRPPPRRRAASRGPRRRPGPR